MKTVMRFLKNYLNSPYGNLLLQLMMALGAGFLITFYTTRFTLLRSITTTHILSFLLSSCLMLLLTVLISMVSYAFARLPEKLRYRQWFKFAFFMLPLPWIVLQTVYLLYYWLFQVDLASTAYVERDFIVVLFCMALIIGYFSACEQMTIIRRQRKRVRKITEEKLEMALYIQELENNKVAIETHLQGLKNLLTQLKENIGVRLEDGTGISVCFWQVSNFFIDKSFAGQKIVGIRLLDGRLGQTDSNTLNDIVAHFPLLCQKVSRSEVVSLLAIQSIDMENKVPELVLRGAEQRKITLTKTVASNLLYATRRLTAILEKGGVDNPTPRG